VRKTAAWVTGVIGGAALGAGIYFGLEARSKWSDASPYCDDHACTDAGLVLIDEADTAADRSNIAFGIAGAAALTELILYWTAPRQASPHVTPMVQPGGGGVVFSTSF